MRVRIASTKATQKITKAMQMVAASKLRRAQTAAEAARPYAEKMDAVISNIASAAAGSPGAPALLAGTGSGSGASAAGVHRRARPFRRLQFVDRASGPRACAVADRPGQRGQDFLRRPQGLRAAPPNLREEHRRARRPALGSPARLRQCRRHRQKGSGALRGRRVRRLHAVLFALQIRDLADPDRPADHSAGGGSAGSECRTRRRLTSTSRKKTRS